MAADDDRPAKELAKGFRKRSLVTAKTMTRLGWQAAKHSLKGSKSKERSEEDAVAFATTMLAELDQLKGFAMKLGQMVSYLDSTLPPAAQKILAQLQSQSRPMEWDAIKALVEAELGKSPEEIFDDFAETPIAAASIGQVHRASKNGKNLAVKVQYPEIRELLAADMKSITKLSKLALSMFPLDGEALASELAIRMQEECDYQLEAKNQKLFASIVNDWPDSSVPDVLPDLSSERVLTTEFVDRNPFYKFLESATQDAKNRAGAAIFRFSFQSIFEFGIYNADPHPGNYLFSDQGEVTFLDFGCVKRFSGDLVDTWKRIANNVLSDDFAAFKTSIVEAGMVANQKKMNFETQWAAMQAMYKPMLSKENSVITQDLIQDINSKVLFQNKNKRYMTMPADWLFVNRLQWGLYSVLAHLESRVDYAGIFREALDSTPQPLQS